MAIFNTVYGGEWKWKPWSNTLAYYPLNWNLNDYSGNWYNSIASGGTLTYPNNKYLQLSSWYSRFQTSVNSITTPLTISLWEKDIPYNTENNIFSLWVDGLWSWFWSFRLLWNSWGFEVSVTNVSAVTTSAYSVTSWVWHYLVGIVNPNNYIKLYIDGVLKETRAISYTPRNPWWYIAIWQCWINFSQSITWYLDEIIFENKERTAQEIADYYNKTKSNYGL